MSYKDILYTIVFVIGLLMLVLSIFGLSRARAADWELIIPGLDRPICVKSERLCLETRIDIREGRWKSLPVDKNIQTECVSHPNCFTYESNTIKGFNQVDHTRIKQPPSTPGS